MQNEGVLKVGLAGVPRVPREEGGLGSGNSFFMKIVPTFFKVWFDS